MISVLIHMTSWVLFVSMDLSCNSLAGAYRDREPSVPVQPARGAGEGSRGIQHGGGAETGGQETAGGGVRKYLLHCFREVTKSSQDGRSDPESPSSTEDCHGTWQAQA